MSVIAILPITGDTCSRVDVAQAHKWLGQNTVRLRINKGESEGPDEGVLHYILALDHRAHQARAVAVKLGPQLIGKRQEFGVARR
jgi:hypothetical protein